MRWAFAALLLAATLLITWSLLDTSSRDTEGGDSRIAGAAPNVPTTYEETVTLSVPGSVRTESTSFPVREGTSYLLSFEIQAIKPDASPGAAMYLGVTLACSGGEEGEAHSIGGTQNLLDGESATLTNHFLLTAQKDGIRSCNVLVSSPYEHVAAVGTEIDINVIWSQAPAGQSAMELDSAQRLPVVIPAGDTEVAFTGTVELDGLEGTSLQVLSTLHLTTCTIVNGSREGGEPMCLESDTDPAGSTFDAELTAYLVDPQGTSCERLESFGERAHVDRKTHHMLMSLDKQSRLPRTLCGERAQFELVVHNAGPAPLVVHGGASSFIILTEG